MPNTDGEIEDMLQDSTAIDNHPISTGINTYRSDDVRLLNWDVSDLNLPLTTESHRMWRLPAETTAWRSKE